MKYANLWTSCAFLLLLQLEMGTARATDSKPSEAHYAMARESGLGASDLDEMWRTGQPFSTIKNDEAGKPKRWTYELSPDGTKLSINVRCIFPTPRVVSNTGVDDQGRKVTTTTYSGPVFPGNSILSSFFPGIYRAPGPIHPLEDPNTTQTPKDLLPPVTGAGTDTTIDDFLARVNTTTEQIEEKNGELVKTIVDKNGRVLTVRFVLSTVKGVPEKPKQEAPPK